MVDDGSTDDTRAILSARAPDVRTICQPNAGDYAARNTGLRAAKGDLVAFCDSDDLWRSDHLATMAALWADAVAPRFAYANFSIVANGEWQDVDKFRDGLCPWRSYRRKVDRCVAARIGKTRRSADGQASCDPISATAAGLGGEAFG